MELWTRYREVPQPCGTDLERWHLLNEQLEGLRVQGHALSKRQFQLQKRQERARSDFANLEQRRAGCRPAEGESLENARRRFREPTRRKPRRWPACVMTRQIEAAGGVRLSLQEKRRVSASCSGGAINWPLAVKSRGTLAVFGSGVTDQEELDKTVCIEKPVGLTCWTAQPTGGYSSGGIDVFLENSRTDPSGRSLNDADGHKRAVPASKAERRLRARLGDLCWKARQRASCAVTGHSARPVANGLSRP